MKLARIVQSSSAPALALVAALTLACLLLTGDPGGRIDYGYDYTWENMGWAENLSAEHKFVGFERQRLDGDGVRYEPYNRHPVLGLALIKLVTVPFPDDAAARVRAARTLMLAFFVGAAALAWLALRRLIEAPWIALAAVLLAFSSVQAVSYADMVSTEVVVALFAVLLAFHGAAVFATGGRFGQLLAKVCVALLLAWQVFALVGPLALLGLGAALRRRDWRSARRHFALGAVAVLFGAAVLGVNLAREHVALGGETPLAEFPSVASALNRVGVAPRLLIDWPRFAGRQLHRLALAATPYAISHFAFGGGAVSAAGVAVPAWGRWHVGSVAAGGIMLLTTLALIAAKPAGRRRGRAPLAALALAGPCWILVMRHQAEHVYESLLLAGVPLAFFPLAFAGIRRSRRPLPPSPPAAATPAPVAASRLGGFGIGAAAISAAVFAAGVLMAAAGSGAEASRQARDRAFKALTADVDAIRELVADRSVLPAYSRRMDRYGILPLFLHGARTTADPHLADLVLRRGQLGLGESLTPRNNDYFLYERRAWEAAQRRYEALAGTAPAAAGGDYQVHSVAAPTGAELLVVRKDCPFAAGLPFGPNRNKRRRPRQVDAAWQEPARFFAHIHPTDPDAALPPSRRRVGFENLRFPRGQWVWRNGGDCYTVRALPDYPIAAITVGQFRRRPGGDSPYHNDWTATFAPPPAGAGASAGQR